MTLRVSGKNFVQRIYSRKVLLLEIAYEKAGIMTEALTPFHITWIPIFDFFKGVFYKVYHMPLNVTIDLECLLIMIPLVLSQMENIHLLLAK